jgi:hypothetical protein
VLIPTALYGLYPDVKKRIHKTMKAIIKGASLNETVARDDLLETSFKKGSIYLERPAKGFEESPNFHAEPLPQLLHEAWLEGKISDERERALFTELIGTPWGLMLLTSRANAQDFLARIAVVEGEIEVRVLKHRVAAYLEALYQFYPALVGVGPFFRLSTNVSMNIWESGNGILYALANGGVPLEEVTRFGDTGTLPERQAPELAL